MEKYKEAKSILQRETRRVKDKWLADKSAEIQNFADMRETKKFYDSLKALYGPTSHGASPIRSKDGTKLLTDKDEIQERWVEYNRELLNCPSSVDPKALEEVKQRPIQDDLALPPTKQEVENAIKMTQSGKSPGDDNIPPEIYKHGGPAPLNELVHLFEAIWTTEQVPQDLKDASIVTIFKRKGDKSLCSNYRGISLLSIAGKILARVLLNRINKNISDNIISESQCGFRKNRGTIDMIFAARQIQEKCREQRVPLYMLFVDLTKAFDTVNRPALWEILRKTGCPDKFVSIVRQLHDNMQGTLKSDSEKKHPFPITNGVKQGCVLAPTLFGIYFAVMLNSVADDLGKVEDSVYIRFRRDGNIFSLKDFKSKKCARLLIMELLYADDCALLSHTEVGLQKCTTIFATACKRFGLTISLSKTEVLYQPAPKTVRVEPKIQIESTTLNVVNRFTYLGSIISDNAGIDLEIASRIKKASAAYGRLKERVWDDRNIRLTTKITVYKAAVLSTLLYGCETWACRRDHIRTLDTFHLNHLRFILKVKWQDMIPNTEILEKCKLTGIEAMIITHQLRWAGHVHRMGDDRIPKQIMLSQLDRGTRDIGRPLQRHKDYLNYAMKKCEIPESKLTEQNANLEPKRLQPTRRAANRNTDTLASNNDGDASNREIIKRNNWRNIVKNGVEKFESNRISDLKAKRAARKEKEATRNNNLQI